MPKAELSEKGKVMPVGFRGFHCIFTGYVVLQRLKKKHILNTILIVTYGIYKKNSGCIKQKSTFEDA